MHSAIDVANWYLSQDDGISIRKLQKLLYYAYSWHLVFSNDTPDELETRLFENKFEAQVHGAVYPELFDKYRGTSRLPRYEGPLPAFSPDEIDVLERVWEVYGAYTGDELESICYQEQPWCKARLGLDAWEACSNPILDEDIFAYYSRCLSKS